MMCPETSLTCADYQMTILSISPTARLGFSRSQVAEAAINHRLGLGGESENLDIA